MRCASKWNGVVESFGGLLHPNGFGYAAFEADQLHAESDRLAGPIVAIITVQLGDDCEVGAVADHRLQGVALKYNDEAIRSDLLLRRFSERLDGDLVDDGV